MTDHVINSLVLAADPILFKLTFHKWQNFSKVSYANFMFLFEVMYTTFKDRKKILT